MTGRVQALLPGEDRSTGWRLRSSRHAERGCGQRSLGMLAVTLFLVAGCGGATVAPLASQGDLLGGIAMQVAWTVDHTETWSSALLRDDDGGGVAAAAGVVVSTLPHGVVEARVTTNGALLWDKDLQGAIAAPPRLAEGIVYVASLDGRLVALRMASGDEVWQAQLGSPLTNPPVITGAFVLILDRDQRLHALRREDGSVLWRTSAVARADIALRTFAEALVVDEGVVAGFTNGTLQLIDFNGQVRWSRSLAGEGRRFRDVLGQPLRTPGGLVIAATQTGGLFGLDPTSGDVVWRKDITLVSAPVLNDAGLLVAQDDAGALHWLDAGTGDTVATLPLEGEPFGALQRFGDLLVLSTFHRGLYLLSARQPWTFAEQRIATGFTPSVAIDEGTLFARSRGGRLFAFTLWERSR